MQALLQFGGQVGQPPLPVRPIALQALHHGDGGVDGDPRLPRAQAGSVHGGAAEQAALGVPEQQQGVGEALLAGALPQFPINRCHQRVVTAAPERACAASDPKAVCALNHSGRPQPTRQARGKR